MDNEKLIEIVRGHESLYDLSHKQYSDTTYKEKIWKQIGEELKQPAITCKTRWTNIRDQFRKALKKKETVSGQAAKKTKKYKFEDQLSFLKPYFQERDTVSNMSYEDSEHEEEEIDELEDADTEPGEFSDICNVNRSILADNTDTDLGNSTNNVQIKTKKRRLEKHAVESASSTLMKYFLKQTEQETKDRREYQPSIADPVDSFLSGISATMKTFSPYHLNLAKTKIFTIVQQIDMQQIMEKQRNDSMQNQSSMLNSHMCTNVQSSQINQNIYSNMTPPTPSLYPTYNNYSNPTPLGIVNPENTVQLPTRIEQTTSPTPFYSNIPPQN